MSSNLLLACVAALAASSAVGAPVATFTPAGSVLLSRGVAAVVTATTIVLAVASAGWPSGTLGDTDAGGPFLADRLALTVSLFAALMTVVVGSYASRSLAAEPRAPLFFAAANLLLAGTVALAAADRPWVVVAAWITVSVAVVRLIAFDGRAASRTAARRAAARFAVGDLTLAAAVGATLTVTSISEPTGVALREIVAADRGGARIVAPVLAIAMIVAAMVRSSQLPFQGWLADSVAAPTPVSALLHAGVVNGSAILLIRWFPVLESQAWAAGLLVAAGLSGVVVGMAVARTRPDIKSGLAWTTVAQMGFMLVQCALGLTGPAVVHMVAHGMFKSRLFLGAGSALERHGHHHPSPSMLPVRRIVGAGAIAAGVVAGAMLVVRPAFLEHPAAALPVVALWCTATYALAQWWARRPVGEPAQLAAATVGLAIAVTASAAVSSAVDHWVGLPAGAAPTAAGALALTAVAVVGLGWGGTLLARRIRPELDAVVWMRAAALATPRRLGTPLVLAHSLEDPS